MTRTYCPSGNCPMMPLAKETEGDPPWLGVMVSDDSSLPPSHEPKFPAFLSLGVITCLHLSLGNVFKRWTRSATAIAKTITALSQTLYPFPDSVVSYYVYMTARSDLDNSDSSRGYLKAKSLIPNHLTMP